MSGVECYFCFAANCKPTAIQKLYIKSSEHFQDNDSSGTSSFC